MLDMDAAYKDYANYVFKFLMTLCMEEHTAEELTQETFYQAVRTANKYDGSCKISTWLCQIAKHLWYQELDRRKKKQAEPLSELTAAESFPSDGPTPEQTLSIKNEKMALFRRVHLLSDIEKEVDYVELEAYHKNPFKKAIRNKAYFGYTFIDKDTIYDSFGNKTHITDQSYFALSLKDKVVKINIADLYQGKITFME